MTYLTPLPFSDALERELRIIAAEKALRCEMEPDLSSTFLRKIAYGFAGVGAMSADDDAEALKRTRIWRERVRHD